MEVRSLYAEPEAADEPERPPALEFKDVFKIYRSGPVETVALRGLDLRVEQREFVAVLGPSGSGKSTLMHLAAALDEPSAGDVRAFGRSLARLTDSERADFRATQLALIFQADNLWPSLSARENATIALRLRGSGGLPHTVADALMRFGLAARADHLPSELSGGEQQRTAIAAAAARRAPLVLADEPTAELDRENEHIVLESLGELRDMGASTIVVVTHSSVVAEAADRVIELRDGRVVG